MAAVCATSIYNSGSAAACCLAWRLVVFILASLSVRVEGVSEGNAF